MEFRLLYRGELKSHNNRSPRAPEKHAIRRVFHKQLKMLWEVDANLKSFAKRKLHMAQTGTHLDVLANKHSRCGFRFVPIATQALGIGCELDILFLRREKPGMVVHRGDIDNRMKLIFDALRMPQECNEVNGQTPDSSEEPFFVLLEDDSLLTKVSINTDRLLTPQEDPQIDDVEVIVGVRTKILTVNSGVITPYSNMEFL